MEHHFLLERITDRKTEVIQTWEGIQTFSKMTEAILSLQGEQLTVLIANDKIWATERQIRSLENWTHYHEIDKFPILQHLSSDVSGDNNKWDF